MDYPVSVSEGGVKFQPENMETERLYHCVVRDKVILIFKDTQDVLNCYEIDDRELVAQIKQCADEVELDAFFERYLLGMGNSTRPIKYEP